MFCIGLRSQASQCSVTLEIIAHLKTGFHTMQQARAGNGGCCDPVLGDHFNQSGHPRMEQVACQLLAK